MRSHELVKGLLASQGKWRNSVSGTLLPSIKESLYSAHLFIKTPHVSRMLHSLYFAPQPNCGFNADANISHAFGIFMAYVGALQPSASGAG